MRPSLTIDIETADDPALTWTPKDGPRADRVPPPPYHQILCIGAIRATPTMAVERVGVFRGEDERTILAAFAAFVQREQPRLVGFNSRSFDLPVIVARLVRYGIPCPWLFTKAVSNRYQDGTLDVADALTNFGAGKTGGLGAWMELCGLRPKLGDGGKVGDMSPEERDAYCMGDVAGTHGLAIRAEYVAGDLSADEYARAAASLLAAIDGEPRLARMAAQIDRERFTLGLKVPVPAEEASAA